MRGVVAPLVLGLAAPAYLAKIATLGGAGAGSAAGGSGTAAGGSGTVAATSGAASAGASGGGLGSLVTAVASGGWVVAGTAALLAGAVAAGAVALGGGSRDESPAAVAQPLTDEDADTHGSAEPLASRGGSPDQPGSAGQGADVAPPATPSAGAGPAVVPAEEPPAGRDASVVDESPSAVRGERSVGDARTPPAEPSVPSGKPGTGADGAPGAGPGTFPVTEPHRDPFKKPGTTPGTTPGTSPGTKPGTSPGSGPGTGPAEPRPEPEAPPPAPAAPTFTVQAPPVTARTSDRHAVLPVAITVTNPPGTAIRATLTVSAPRITFLDEGGCAPLGEGRTRCVVTLDGRSTTVLVPWRPRGVGNTGTVDVALELAVSGDVVDSASTRITVGSSGRGGN
jgi:hypothetical protein